MRLSRLERAILRTLDREPIDAYGVTIAHRVTRYVEPGTGLFSRLSARWARNPSIGWLYVALNRLEQRGMVASWQGDRTPERGWRPKRYYLILPAGRDALYVMHR